MIVLLHNKILRHQSSGFPAHQGKVFYFFPVREKSENLRKRASNQGILIGLYIMRVKKQTKNKTKNHKQTKKQVIEVFFSWSFLKGIGMTAKISLNLMQQAPIWPQLCIHLLAMNSSQGFSRHDSQNQPQSYAAGCKVAPTL